MGVLSTYFKPNFLGLLKFLNSMNWFIVLFSLINLSECIYEDQIGKFDWRQTYVGRVKFAQFDTVSTAKKIILATEENVLAALNLKTGQVVWRHVFESTSAGNIQLLHVSDKVVSVSGSNPYLVRTWDTNSGVLIWEWSLVLQNEEQAEFSEWFVQNNILVHMLPVFGSHFEVTMYNLMTGQNKGSTSKLPASWNNIGCVLSPPYYTCISGKDHGRTLISLDLTSNAVKLISSPLDKILAASEGMLKPLDGKTSEPGFIIDDKKIVLIQDSQFLPLNVPVSDSSSSVTVIDAVGGTIILEAWSKKETGFHMKGYSLSTGRELSEVHNAEPNRNVFDPEISAAMCTKSAKEQLVCRILITATDDASHLMQQEGKILWTREEALANVVAVEFVDLPVSDLDAAIESEFDQKEGSIWGAFTRRLYTQFQQLHTLFHALQSQETEEDQPAPLVRDYFNLHKVIVLVTDVGKIFGMDNLSGAILWQRHEPELDAGGVVVFTRRSARHPPHAPCLTIVGKHESTGNGLVISLNPIRGTLSEERILSLDVQLSQVALLHNADEEKLHALVLLDKDQNVQVLPKSSEHLVENLFMYVANKRTARVQGYALRYDGTSVVAEKTWSINLGGQDSSGHRIVTVAGKRANERVHSPGKVLGDRSVLYKYINPNLVLFVTEGPDPLHKDMVVATCVDAVSGAIVSAQAHRRARALPLAVHADNFMAYIYHNDKHRRTEIATIELYEGATRWISPGGAFSSLVSERAARVAQISRAAYILPATPIAAARATTERGLTDNHVLLAFSTGAILEMPWAYLEPRRPVSPTAEEREEGLVPYAPELPLPAEAVINYNRTLYRVQAIHTAPSGLESTSLVLATGLDLFYTRVAPSKTFDLLKEDFDYYLISVVLVALLVTTYSTRYFASRKLLKMAWK